MHPASEGSSVFCFSKDLQAIVFHSFTSFEDPRALRSSLYTFPLFLQV